MSWHVKKHLMTIVWSTFNSLSIFEVD